MKIRATCHGNAKHYAKGLCRPCYLKSIKVVRMEAKRQEDAKLVTINLQMRHSINGKFYGPGPVTITPAKAAAFLNTEHIAGEKEFNLMQVQSFILGLGPGGPVKRQVSTARFDEILSRAGEQ